MDSDMDDDDDIGAAVLAEEQRMRTEVLGAAPAPSPGVTSPEKPKRARKKAATRESNLAYEQKVQLVAGSLTATGSSLVAAANLQPPFTSDHGMALAEAWVPVLEYYAGESDNPLTMALITTGVMVLPYLYQVMQRQPTTTETPANAE